MALIDPISNPIAQVTKQGRNLLSRSILGEISFQLKGFSVGRGGYDPLNVNNPLPIVDNSEAAMATIEIIDNNFDVNDTITINTVDFIVATDWSPGIDTDESALALAEAINNSTNSFIRYKISAVAVGAIITLSSLVVGTIGNSFTLSKSDGITNNFTLSGYTFTGGLDEDLLDQIFPLSGYKVFENIETPNTKATSMVCRLAQSEANYGLGELGIWVEVLNSSIGGEIGQVFLYSISHMAFTAKSERSVKVQRIIIQY